MFVKPLKYVSAISLNERIKFLKLLLRWKGSLWKLLLADFLWFISLYIAVTLLYRLYLIKDPINKKRFEMIVLYMNKVAAVVPLSFLLGFFVSTVLGRWWKIVKSLPWMTKSALICQSLITGPDRMMCRDIRLTILRYMNLSWILSVMNLSQKVKQRFAIIPSKKKERFNKKDKLSEQATITVRQRLERINSDEAVKIHFGKLIMDEEIGVYENLDKMSNKPGYIIPLMWTTKLIEKCRDAGHIKSENVGFQLFNMVQSFEDSLEDLSVFNEFNVPLVYTQVVIIVVYIFLISEIFSQQIISIETNILDTYFPIFGIFKFFIYMGWFKVGLSLINPFGSESSDLPLDEILDYNLQISSSVASSNDSYFPEYLTDSFNDSNKDPFGVLGNFRLTLSGKEELQGDQRDQELPNKVENNQLLYQS